MIEPQHFFVVVDPNGIFVHPTISLKPDEAIQQWIETEQACNLIVNAGRSMRRQTPRCAPSWEHFEAEGYRVIPVTLHADNA